MKRCIQTIWSTVSHHLRFILGIAAFAMALMSPLLIPVITTLDICGSKKALLSGAMILVGPIMNVILFYLPGYFPEWIGYRQWLGISCDVIFVVALFIAGEQLWEKIEAIFRFDEVSPVQG